ncbi:YhcG family protein [Chitinophaga sp. RCC_12]|uniref:PDDEXK nuclease domain-containing protein n=1 Tax=Chitinophaga sp. RCC_12 TaxID=3239226 RepID=UPI0035263402
MKIQLPETYIHTLESLKQKIQHARMKAVLTANVQLLATYWEIGNTISQQEQNQGWGSKVVEELARDLSIAFPDFKGLSPRNLRYMRNFAIAWPELSVFSDQATAGDMNSILQQAAAKLPWFHICTLLDKVKNQSERNFYAEKAVENGWSRNILVHQIESGLFNRQGKVQNNFANTLPAIQSELASELFKDPYKFDFFNLANEAKERDLENALVDHIMKFMLEMGKGFSFVGKQTLINAGEKDYYIDLLLYHLKLHCYVAIELKIGEFKPEYAGKMNFYLSTLDNNYKTSGDTPSIGLILCKNKDRVTVEYALKDVNKPMGVAEYQLTHLIPKNLQGQLPSIEDLEKELKKEVTYAKSNQKKREQLGTFLSKLSPQVFRKEKSMPVIKELWDEVSYKLKPALEKAFKPEQRLFEYLGIIRSIDNKNAEGILASQSLKLHTKEIGLHVKMDTFKSAGSKAFSISKVLRIKLQESSYTLSHNSTSWLTKRYHETFTEEEIKVISGRLSNLALAEINRKLKQIVG